MTAAVRLQPNSGSRGAGLPTILKLGARELRGGLSGFRVFIACLALGVMVIAAVGALADALKAGMLRQGEMILGGDVTFARMHARATPQELGVIAGLGRTSETATLRTMARRIDGSEQALAELKAVDARYPLAGDVVLKDGSPFDKAIAGDGIVADAMLLERLGAKVGDRIRIGEAELPVQGVLQSEPDGVADRLTYGPRVFLSLATLARTGLVKPGTLIRWRYAVKLDANAPQTREALADLRKDVASKLPEAGFASVDRFNPSPQVTRALDQLRQFLILIGLASLLVGGVGIANAVATFIDKRVKVIATLRSVGARGSQIIGIFLVQVLLMSAIGVAIGLTLGVAVPSIIGAVYGDMLPVPVDFAVSPRSLGIAALYGFLVAGLFVIWPIGRVERVRANVLFRETLGAAAGRPRSAIVITTGVLVAALFAVALATSERPAVALYVAGGLIVMLAIFGWLGGFIARRAGRLPRPSSPELALALRNIASPDGLTRSVVLSLGTGLTLLVAVALANASMVADLTEKLPAEAPDYFVLDINPKDFDAFKAKIAEHASGAKIIDAPMLRGRLVSIKGTPVEELKVPGDAQWVLNGDRGLSYADTVPEGSTVTAGTWWGKDYQGPPLVSFEAELAKKLGFGIGDKVTVNVLGRNLEATVANLREVKWESLALNFVMVFSPNALQAAPHNLLATVRLPANTSSASETAMIRDIGRALPSITPIRVRDAIDQVSKIFAKVMVAVQVAGSVTLVAGALVLAGALATAQRRRTLEAVILKTIGARRRQIMTAHACEYALLAVAAAVVATGLGSLIAWVAVTRVLEIGFVFSLRAVLVTILAAGAMITTLGGFGTWRILRARSVPYLRSE